MDDAMPQPPEPFTNQGVPFLPPPVRTVPTTPTAPTAWSPPSDPFANAPQMSVAPNPPPKRRRTGVLVGVGALVVAGVVAGVMVLGGGESNASYDLQAATKAAAEAQNVAFEMTMDAGPVQMTMAARLDVEGQLMAMTAEMPIVADSGSIEAIIDIGGKVMYMNASGFPGAEGLPTKWISMDLSKVPGVAQSFGGFTDVNPLDAAGLFENATTVQDKGLEPLQGEEVKHYVVTVDLAAAMAAQPDLFEQVDAAGADLPETIDYDVWVTEDNQLRRMSFTMDLAGQTIDMDMTVTAVGTIDPIVVPAADEVTDITDMLPAG